MGLFFSYSLKKIEDVVFLIFLMSFRKFPLASGASISMCQMWFWIGSLKVKIAFLLFWLFLNSFRRPMSFCPFVCLNVMFERIVSSLRICGLNFSMFFVYSCDAYLFMHRRWSL